MTAQLRPRIVATLALTCAALVPPTAPTIATAPTGSAVPGVASRPAPTGSAVPGVASRPAPTGSAVPGASPRAPTGLLAPGVASLPAFGNDISWPQCPKGTGIPSRRGQGQPMPPASATFVVIGVTNGPAFYPNPCLATQTAWAKAHHVYTATYAMTTYPTPHQLAVYGSKGPYQGTGSAARLANTGYAQAQFNVASMRKAGLVSPFMWVDVEPYPAAPWTTSTTANKAVVDGALRGYRAAGFKVGVYSNQSGWPQVVGAARYGLPEWRTAGPRPMSVARSRCSGPSFQGGRAVLAQWWTRTTDYDMTCPVASTQAVLTAYFHKY